MGFFDEKPIPIEGLRMIRRLVELLAALPEAEHLAQQHHEAWAGYLVDAGIKLNEIEAFGAWYPQYHTIHPAFGQVVQGAQYLRKHGSLPPHRIPCEVEILAGQLINTVESAGFSDGTSVNALLLAATLLHRRDYQRLDNNVDKDGIAEELAGTVRVSMYISDDILTEINRGTGALGHLREMFNPD